MEKADIEVGINQLNPWFHKIELPHGLTTKTETSFGEPEDHPLSTWKYVRQVLPDNLSGKRVLDIGCNGGFYALEANKRGAEVLGVDARRFHVRQASFAAHALGLHNIRFSRRSLYELDPATDGTYDIVLALGLIYHLKHLVSGMEILYDMCSELLILETAVLLTPEQTALSSSPEENAQEEGLSLDYTKNDPFSGEAAANWFIPSARTVKAMLEDIGFVDVTISHRFRDRAVLTARKPTATADSRFPAFLKAEFQDIPEAIECLPNETINLSITTVNTGRGRWLSRNSSKGDRGAVGLFLYLTKQDDPLFGQEHHRIYVQKDIEPGQRASWDITLKAPAHPGTYFLEIDLISENIILFQDTGHSPATVRLEVR